jgi:hypothetical protein
MAEPPGHPIGDREGDPHQLGELVARIGLLEGGGLLVGCPKICHDIGSRPGWAAGASGRVGSMRMAQEDQCRYRSDAPFRVLQLPYFGYHSAVAGRLLEVRCGGIGREA